MTSERLWRSGGAGTLLNPSVRWSRNSTQQLRDLRQEGFIRHRGTTGSGVTAAFLFNRADVFTARIMIELLAYGIHSRGAMAAVHHTCYGKRGAEYDAEHVLRDTLTSENAWQFQPYATDASLQRGIVFEAAFRSNGAVETAPRLPQSRFLLDTRSIILQMFG